MQRLETSETYRAEKTERGSLWRLVAALAFAVIPVPLLFSGPPGSRLVGALLVLWFGFTSFQRLHAFRRERSFLRVSPEGLEIGVPWRSTFYAWSDIERFGSVEVPLSYFYGTEKQILAAFDLKPTYPGPRPRRTRGFDVVFPDEFDLNGRLLANQLNELKDIQTGAS